MKKFTLLSFLFLALGSVSFAQINVPVDCASGSLNYTYCYDSNELTEIIFTSSGGFPLTIEFNAGTLEQCCDDLTVFDSNGDDLSGALNGNLSGITYTSSGDSISFVIDSDFSVSCNSGSETPIDITVTCLTCVPPTATFTVVDDCASDTPTFSIDVDLSDFGSASFIQIVDDQGSPGQLPSVPGIFTFGPYVAGTDVVIDIQTDDTNCEITSDVLTSACPPPPNECSIVYAGPDQTFDCTNNNIALDASFMLTGQDFNEYEINALSSCPIPPSTGGTQVSLNVDDEWSDVIDLGFDFCFFGTTYNQIVIGSNGVASFDTSLANGFNDWGFSDPLPNNTDGALSEPNIFAGLHDIDPSDCGDLNYSVLGSSPTRQFVINFTDVCHFGFGGCDDMRSSMQIILYESSNNIDINIFEKPACTEWNGGRAVIGIQNPASDIAFVPAGRNTGVWTVDPSAPESYRFSPGVSSTPNYVFQWYEELPGGNLPIASTPTVNVNPSETTTYVAEISYNQCDGSIASVTDSVTIEFTGTTSNSDFTIIPSCDGGATVTIDGDTGGSFAFNPSPTDGTTIDSVTGEVSGGVLGETYFIEYSVDPSSFCGSTTIQSFVASANPEFDFINTDSYELCPNATTPIVVSAQGQNFTESEVSITWELNGSLINNETSLELDNVITPGEYTLNVMFNSTMCQASKTVTVEEFPSCVYPQAISPNNDGLNDRFDLTAFDLESLVIYNRNGKEIFIKSNGYTDQWYGQDKQGNDIPTGTYYFVAKSRNGEVKASWVYVNRAQ